MTPEARALLKDLLVTQRVLSLAVLVDGRPYAGMLPFAMLPDFSAALVHASALAKHAAGLTEGTPFSLLIHQPDRYDADPQQLPRVTLQGRVQLYGKESTDYITARAVYLDKFPQSEQTFALGDFNLYALLVESGRFVAGFGQIYNLTSEALRQLGE